MNHINGNKRELIVKKERINDLRFINKYFEEVNKQLKIGGIFKGNVETYQFVVIVS